MEAQRQILYTALSKVEEPDLKRDLVSLGMVKAIDIADGKAKIQIQLTTPACPLKEVIRERCITAIVAEFDLNPEMTMPEIEIDYTAEVLSGRASAGAVLSGVRNVIAVCSGKGGVGKSTVTANLAYALAASGARVGLIDADISGPSVPLMFGLEGEQPGLEEREGRNVIIPIERYGVKLLSIGFLTPTDSAVVWRGPMMSSALRQFINDADWGELDYLLFDMPPGTSDIHLTLVQTVPVTGAVVVTTPQRVALTDAQKAISMFSQGGISVPVLGVVENMSYFSPAELPGSRYYIFGQGGGQILAQRNNLPLLGEIPLVQSIREAGDNGLPIVGMAGEEVSSAFTALAERVAQEVSVVNARLNTVTV
jgi:ATP-binding protein involved in chromosome partitioning